METVDFLTALIATYKPGDEKFLQKIGKFLVKLNRTNEIDLFSIWGVYEIWLASLAAEDKDLEIVKAIGRAIKTRMRFVAENKVSPLPRMGGQNPAKQRFASLTKDPEFFGLEVKK